MVDSGQDEIAEVGFASKRHARLPAEVVDRNHLVERLRAHHPGVPRRASFFMVILVEGGAGTHTVDFEAVPVRPGRLILIHPEQVQLWDADAVFDASVVLARPEVAPVRRWFPGDRAHRDLGADSLATAESLIAALGREQNRFTDSESCVRLMNALFIALLALFDRVDPQRDAAPLPEAYVAFRAAVEADVTRSRNVRNYVAELGFSERTVSRACRQVTGRSAKALLDDRLILEAKRLLAHTSEPAAAIAAGLGFSEATNFAKFFTRHTGQLASAFREDVRGASTKLKSSDPRE